MKRLIVILTLTLLLLSPTVSASTVAETPDPGGNALAQSTSSTSTDPSGSVLGQSGQGATPYIQDVAGSPMNATFYVILGLLVGRF